MLKNKNTILLLMAGCCSITSYAQTAVPVKMAPTNYLELLMLVIAALLVLVILVLSNVLIMISKKVVEVSKGYKKIMMIFIIAFGSMFSNHLIAQNAVIADTTSAIGIPSYYGGLSSTSFWTLSTVLALELLIIFLMVLFIKNMWKVIHPVEIAVEEGKPVTQSWLIKTWDKLDSQFFTKAAPIEREADVLLDHDYDGIKELDNALPPWWKYGFYITILVAVFYLLKFEVWHTGQNPTEEYAAEMTEGKASVDAYLASAKENVDENSVTIADAIGVAAGKELFNKTCIACHMADGGGGVGPNLTDDYWIHGGDMKQVFKTLKYGWPDKGMQAWASTYSPVQLQQLASYVKSLKGNKAANPKAPQGDLYIEEANISDSTLKKIDVKKDSIATK